MSRMLDVKANGEGIGLPSSYPRDGDVDRDGFSDKNDGRAAVTVPAPPPDSEGEP